MLAGSRERSTEVFTATTAPELSPSSVLGPNFRARSSKYLVVLLKPTVKRSCISGGARAPASESPPSGKADEWPLMVKSSFLFLFFARFPLEGAIFRDLCSPMGLSRLHKEFESAFDLQRPGHPISEARHMHFNPCRDFSESCKTKGDLVKTVGYLVLVGIGGGLPAEHVQYLCLVIGGYYWPGGMVKIGSIGSFEMRAHHRTSVYGVSRLKIIFGFLVAADVGLPSMTATCSGF